MDNNLLEIFTDFYSKQSSGQLNENPIKPQKLVGPDEIAVGEIPADAKFFWQELVQHAQWLGLKLSDELFTFEFWQSWIQKQPSANLVVQQAKWQAMILLHLFNHCLWYRFLGTVNDGVFQIVPSQVLVVRRGWQVAVKIRSANSNLSQFELKRIYHSLNNELLMDLLVDDPTHQLEPVKPVFKQLSGERKILGSALAEAKVWQGKLRYFEEIFKSTFFNYTYAEQEELSAEKAWFDHDRYVVKADIVRFVVEKVFTFFALWPFIGNIPAGSHEVDLTRSPSLGWQVVLLPHKSTLIDIVDKPEGLFSDD